MLVIIVGIGIMVVIILVARGKRKKVVVPLEPELPIPHSPTTYIPPARFCPNCGVEIQLGVKFCSQCGAAI